MYNRSGHAKKLLYSFNHTVWVADVEGPRVVNYRVCAPYYGKNDTVYIAVKFNEPVQVDPNGTDIKGNKVKLGLQTLIGKSTVNFEYVDGTFTDTLIFAANLDKEYVSEDIKVLSFLNVYSYGNGGVRVMDLMWNNQNQNNLFVAPKGTTSSPLATLSAYIDTRPPEIKFVSCDSMANTSRQHTVNVKIENVTQLAKVYYAWSTSSDKKNVSEWKSTPFETSDNTQITGKDLTGDYYLHVKVEGYTGQVAYWCSEQAFKFDNDFPVIESVSCDNPTAAADYHDLSVTIRESQMEKIACVYMYVLDSNSKMIIGPEEVYNRSKADDSLMKFANNDNVGLIKITAEKLNLEDNAYTTFSIGFDAVDIYGNRTPSPFYSTQVLYDTRKDFKADIQEEPIRDLNGYQVHLNTDQSYTINFAPQSGGGITEINVYGIFSIKRNGEYIYDISNENNYGGKTYTLDTLKEYLDNGTPLEEVNDLLLDLFSRDGWLIEKNETCFFGE